MAHWHGFKQYAVDLGLTVRSKLGLSAFDRLDLTALATHYNATVVSFDQLDCSAEVLHYLTVQKWHRVSGYLLPVDGQFAIVTNPSHENVRVRSTIAHEIAHLVLNHEFSVLATTDDGCAFGDKDQEDEASWFGAELLVPRQAAERAVHRRMSLEQLSSHFDVSVELARWRTNICGARKILQRSRAR